MYGPSADLEPSYKRRTVYGKVSRYKLDEYLALFDFPSPKISAEKRFATNVPAQRLFFMNSDFVQQQAELLARNDLGGSRYPREDQEGVRSAVRSRTERRKRSRPASNSFARADARL